ncbi:MAG: LacI family transcriptional regulator [Lactobacillaceae bacterium]|jgi:DNA-binding LacI/PurR family transcriptional regulator|nr:LacI family transcriptional regulator [Lactobacillaceae bacterium]
MKTLNDVALKAHVSRMTVSRVINHPEAVSKEVRELVLQAIKELNYTPNHNAKALSNNKFLSITLLVLEDTTTTDPYFTKLILGASRYLETKGYSLKVSTDKKFDDQTDGYIVIGFRDKDIPWLNSFDKPVVLFGENNYDIPFVDSDNLSGTTISTKKLIDAKYSPISYLGIDLDQTFAKKREQGFNDVMKRHNLPVNIYRMKNSSSFVSNFLHQNPDLLQKGGGIIAGTDRIALGVIRAARELGLNIPEDFGIIGFDGFFINKVTYPLLTTIEQNINQIGEVLSKIILNWILTGNIPEPVLVDTNFIQGQTIRK